ncbi:Uncharacterized protein BM_BM17240 [Brugia malayi]|uniref:Aamy domain-containing protein n=1 Tax=Brugia malayi TaxID=6279 RepID=A0A4E9FSW8_BRUMA|nr:Uncharacterized protein BM_BM17240 [Brugia malayi]VIP00414.1 Uncharacterized protein BM_BM17240 [Brugia malayi]
MDADDSRMPLSEDTKTPQVYKLEIKESSYEGIQATFSPKFDENGIKRDEKMIGLTKNELEQYCNDPFWKVVRCTIPKCATIKEPEWWRKQVSYQIFTPSFRDSNDDGIGDFNGIREKLNDLRKTGIKTILGDTYNNHSKEIIQDDFIPLDVIDFTSVDERFGTMNDLKLLIDATHELDMHFTMDLPISTTSASHKWFKSAKAGGDYVGYYIWKEALDVKDNPNYIVEEGKKDAYLAYDGKDPILDWSNPAVKKSIFEVAKSFIDMGVDGFHVDRIGELIKYLPKSEGYVALSMINDFIGNIRDYANSTETPSSREIAVFSSLSDFTKLQDPDGLNLSNLAYVIDDSVTKLNNESCPNGIAQCLHSTLITSFKWFNTTHLPHACSSRITTFLVSIVLVRKQIYWLMQWNSSEYRGFTAGSQKSFFSTMLNYNEDNFQTQSTGYRSPLKTLKAVAKMHHRDYNFALGETQLAPLTQDVILFGRFYQSTNSFNGAAYLIGANFGTSDVEIDGMSVLPDNYMAATAEIAIVTPNVDKYLPRDKISSFDKIVLGPKQGVIIKVQ